MVGKGGGYAEMQAILINSKLELLTEVCTTTPAACNLSNQEAANLQQAVAGSFNFKVNPGCFDPSVQIQSSSVGMVSACALYHDDSSAAKEFKDIAAWVLTTRLMAVSGLSLSEAYALAEKVFAQYSQVENSLMMNLSEADAVFHFLQIQVGSYNTNVVSLEGRTRTLEITDLVQARLNCENSELQNWTLRRSTARDLGNAQGLLETEVQWTCANQTSWTGKLQIYFAALYFEIDPGALQLRMVGKSPLR